MVGAQNSDGGFPCKGREGNPSCLNDTCFWIGKMISQGAKEMEGPLHRACEWVLSTQSSEGAFVEPIRLRSVPNLPPWVAPGKPTPNMPQLVAYLLEAGYGERVETRRAIAHLLGYWRNVDGSFRPGYMVWCLIEVLRKMGLPEDSVQVGEAVKATRSYIDSEARKDASALLWCLNSLRSAGFGKDSELVGEVSGFLLALRRDDGGWAYEDGEGRIQKQSDPALTEKVLHALRSYGLV